MLHFRGDWTPISGQCSIIPTITHTFLSARSSVTSHFDDRVCILFDSTTSDSARLFSEPADIKQSDLLCMYRKVIQTHRINTDHPNNSSRALTAHTAAVPDGSIIHDYEVGWTPTALALSGHARREGVIWAEDGTGAASIHWCTVEVTGLIH